MLLTENTDLCHKRKKEIKLVLLIIPSFLRSTKYDNAFMHRPHNVFEVHILHWITKHVWNETSSIVSCKHFATLKCFFFVLYILPGNRTRGGAWRFGLDHFDRQTLHILLGFEYLVTGRNGENDSFIAGVNHETWRLIIMNEKVIKEMRHTSGISRLKLSKVGSVWDQGKFLIPILTVT